MILDNPCHPDRRVEKEAASLVAAGHQVTILAWDRTGRLPASDRVSGATVLRVAATSADNRGLGQLLPMLRFWAAATLRGRRLRFDLVHCHDLPTLPIGVTLAKLRRVPLVYDIHEIYPLMMHSRLPGAACRLLSLLERVLLRRAARVVTVSPMLRDHYSGAHPSISIVGNWYDPIELDAGAGHALRGRLGIAPETFVLAYVGFFGPERLHGLLLEYAGAHPEVAVVMAGSGAGVADVAAAAAALPNLHYLGQVARPEPVFAAADALFYGLVDTDPYSAVISPNNLFQSIAMRRPLIATGPGDAGRVVSATGAGITLKRPTVEALHAAVTALRDPARRAAVEAAQGRLQPQYSWRKAAETLLRAHDEAMGAQAITSSARRSSCA
jgi:glycosyltransferase involved in cell wall biosynthesis